MVQKKLSPKIAVVGVLLLTLLSFLSSQRGIYGRDQDFYTDEDAIAHDTSTQADDTKRMRADVNVDDERKAIEQLQQRDSANDVTATRRVELKTDAVAQIRKAQVKETDPLNEKKQIEQLQQEGSAEEASDTGKAEANDRDAKGEQAPKKESEPMNVVLLYADDWSFNTLGAMGNTYVQTPHLDQLAAEGMLFTHNCVVTSVCMQSRATLYTGQYASRHKTFFSWRNITMYEEERWNNTLYPNMIRNGYQVGFFGKYHHLEPWPQSIPTFTRHMLYQQSHYKTFNGVTKHITQWAEEHGLDFLETRPKDQPFFLTLSFFATHAEDGNQIQYRPMNESLAYYNEGDVPVPKTFNESYWEEMPWFFDSRNFGRGRYGKRYSTPELYQTMMKNMLRMATEVDTVCGRIIAKLKEQGIYDNTLILFTTDNGNIHGQHGLAEKWYAYEESLRVPLIIRDPRMPTEKIGKKNDDFTLNLDLASTILSATGARVPDTMQGRDLADLYLTEKPNWRQEFLYEYWDENEGIPNSFALVRKESKYILWTDYNYSQFFDMKNDPYEEFDVHNETDKHMIKEVRQRMDELLSLAEAGVSL